APPTREFRDCRTHDFNIRNKYDRWRFPSSTQRLLTMSTPRFYYPGSLASHQAIDLPDDLSHHAVRVLRMRDGQDIVLFNGEGGQYPATLIVEGKRGRAQLGAHADIEAELDGDITLAQGIPSGAKMDWVVEKAVELGVRR